MKILQQQNNSKYYLYWVAYILMMCIGARGVMAQGNTKKDSLGAGQIQIIHADRTGFKKFSDSTMIRFASGNVAVRQSNTLFYCDSVAANPETQITEAYGHVHINDNDSIQVYSDFMRYKGAERTAFLKNNVKLTDGSGVLTTSALDYDLNTQIAVYSQKGKLVNGKTVLTSQSGTYYGDTKDAEFNKDVHLVDPEYEMTTDTLLYNTITKVSTFTVPTLIKQGPFKSIQTTDGYYDLLHKTAYLGKRPTIIDSSSILIADEVAADDSSGFAEARGSVIFRDTAQGMVVLCNDLKSSRENASFLATINPIAIIKQETDSLFIAADTLYSSRFSNDTMDIKIDTVKTDSLMNTAVNPSGDQKDSTLQSADRYITDHLPTTDSLGNTKQPVADSLQKDSSRGFKKVGNIFVWDTDTASPKLKIRKGLGLAPKKQRPTQQQGVAEQPEKKGLFGFLKGIGKKKDSKQPVAAAPAAIDNKKDTTLPGAPADSVNQADSDSSRPVRPGMMTQEELIRKKRAEEQEKERKSIFDLFRRKKEAKGKEQPAIIDSIKASKPEGVADSLNSGKPGLDFSVDKSSSSKDSLPAEDKKNRFLEAYYNVRIYSDSLQGIGDSLYYSGRDSLMQLFKTPTVWTTSNNQISQITGDTILVQTANNKPEYIRVANNALMISQADTLHQEKTSKFFNQMAGNKLEAWFTDGQLDSLSTQGSAHGIFYSLDALNKYIGVTQQDSRELNFYFIKKELQRIVGKKDVVGRVYPMGEVDHEKIRLKGFEWKEEQRPKSKYDLFAH